MSAKKSLTRRKTSDIRKCAIVSFRLGALDGVSVVAKLWQEMLEDLEIKTFTLAGAGTADFILPGLAIGASNPPSPSELEEVLAPADLVIVENLLTIPLNLPAAEVLAEVFNNALADKHIIIHHHDPPWQRDEYKHITQLPISNPDWVNITINKLTQREMASRGIAATCIYNPFKIDLPPNQELEAARERTRRRLKIKSGVGEDELVIVHPARAIPSKNIPGAIRIAEELGGTYWLTGHAEAFQKYEAELNRLLEEANCRTIWEVSESPLDMYAAADLVVFPSFWESFGMPPVEASIYGRHCIVGDYPVADELMNLGIKWFKPNELDEVRKLLFQNKMPSSSKGQELLEQNRKVIEKHFSLEVIREQLAVVISRL